MKQLLTLIISLILITQATAQLAEDAISIYLLDNDFVAEATLDEEAFLVWIKEIVAETETFFAKDKEAKDVAIVLTLHKDKDVTIKVVENELLSTKTIKKLNKKLQKHQAPRNKIMDYSIGIVVAVAGGNNTEEDYFSLLSRQQHEEDYKGYSEMTVFEKQAEIQRLVNEEILPLLAYYETNVSEEFLGVWNMGKAIQDDKHLSKSTEDLTINNMNYWRAMMEMTPGNQLVPFTKYALHLSKGEYDKARELGSFMALFVEEGTLVYEYMDEFLVRIEMLETDLATLIEEGIVMHDNQDYEGAINHYEKLLQDFPNSAWLRYEYYYSRSMLEEDLGKALWAEEKDKIYACDPMYGYMAHISTGKEAYQLLLRQEAPSTFAEGVSVNTLLTYATIALDLENYDLAAHLYWWILLFTDEESDYDRDYILAFYLYCMDKMGQEQIIQIFEGDWDERFIEIRVEREFLMEESEIYNAFETKE